MTTGRRSDLAPLARPLPARAASLVRVDDDRDKVRRALVQMTALGGDAGWLAEQLAPRAAAWPDERLQRRDAAIVAFASGCEASGNRGRAREIAKMMCRYSADQRMNAAPEAWGPQRRALFSIVKDGGAIGAEAIRKILAEAHAAGDSVGILPPLSNTQARAHTAIRSNQGNRMNAAIKPTELAALSALARRPDVQKTVAEDLARIVAERKARLDRIATLDKKAETEWPAGQLAIKAAVAKVREAERRLREANEGLLAANAAASRATNVYTLARQAEEGVLVAGADGATIEALKSKLLDELDRLRRGGVLIIGAATERNAVTRRATIRRFSNVKSVHARMLAVRDAYEKADLLKIEPDQAGLPAVIAEIWASLPTVDQSPDFQSPDFAETEA